MAVCPLALKCDDLSSQSKTRAAFDRYFHSHHAVLMRTTPYSRSRRSPESLPENGTRLCRLDQPQHAATNPKLMKFSARCGWSRTIQQRSGIFRQALSRLFQQILRHSFSARVNVQLGVDTFDVHTNGINAE